MSTNFILLTPRLILIPTPFSITISAYREMYRSLHGMKSFCEMAFGPHLLARDWSEEETWAIMKRSNDRGWSGKGMGDMAVGLCSIERSGLGRVISAEDQEELRIVEGEECENLLADQSFIDAIDWAGYAGCRDATLSMPERNSDDPELPPWQELVEVRYGVGPSHWGKGIAPEAERAAMRWAVVEKGVKRFVAETERANTRSGGVLIRMGFRQRDGHEYWKEPGTQVEWEKQV
ncbi:hypothetical protein C8J56DRAFT_936831 [Mycena floridula]|nr:hypothetical protein C8J56DRAFT_936831 [Mycena floridula]